MPCIGSLFFASCLSDILYGRMMKHTTRTLRCVVRELVHRVDVNSLGRIPNPSGMAMNDIVRVELKLQQPILADKYLGKINLTF